MAEFPKPATDTQEFLWHAIMREFPLVGNCGSHEEGTFFRVNGNTVFMRTVEFSPCPPNQEPEYVDIEVGDLRGVSLGEITLYPDSGTVSTGQGACPDAAEVLDLLADRVRNRYPEASSALAACGYMFKNPNAELNEEIPLIADSLWPLVVDLSHYTRVAAQNSIEQGAIEIGAERTATWDNTQTPHMTGQPAIEFTCTIGNRERRTNSVATFHWEPGAAWTTTHLLGTEKHFPYLLRDDAATVIAHLGPGYYIPN